MKYASSLSCSQESKADGSNSQGLRSYFYNPKWSIHPRCQLKCMHFLFLPHLACMHYIPPKSICTLSRLARLQSCHSAYNPRNVPSPTAPSSQDIAKNLHLTPSSPLSYHTSISISSSHFRPGLTVSSLWAFRLKLISSHFRVLSCTFSVYSLLVCSFFFFARRVSS
jgi:hypothetical protein